MSRPKQNYYGSLCAEMYEILHKTAPREELDFYLSYAEKEKKILEPLCGSGRFLVPFMERGIRYHRTRPIRRNAEQAERKSAQCKSSPR